jgi:MoaA/NifB/PqqE/SkfB family radical SAM enzyme
MLCLEISGEGEPLLSPHIREIVHCAYSNGFVTTLITNGHALAPELTEFLFNHDVTLVVSLFSLDQCLYESDNGLPGSFIPTLRNICRAAEVYKFGTKSDADRQIFRMAIHTTVQVDNVDHLADIRAFCDTWGIFLSVAPLALVGGGAKHPHLLAEGEGASKAMEIGDNSIILSATSLEEMGRQVCGTCMYGLNVGFDGNVLFDAHAGYEVGSSLGNVRSHDIKELVRRQRMCARFLFSSIDGFCPVRDRKWPDFLRRWQAAVSKGLDLGSINDIAHQSVANASWHAGSLPLCRSCLS